MGPGMFDGLKYVYGCVLALLVLFVPLGLWKLCEILYWLYIHVRITP